MAGGVFFDAVLRRVGASARVLHYAECSQRDACAAWAQQIALQIHQVETKPFTGDESEVCATNGRGDKQGREQTLISMEFSRARVRNM